MTNHNTEFMRITCMRKVRLIKANQRCGGISDLPFSAEKSAQWVQWCCLEYGCNSLHVTVTKGSMWQRQKRLLKSSFSSGREFYIPTWVLGPSHSFGVFQSETHSWQNSHCQTGLHRPATIVGSFLNKAHNSNSEVSFSLLSRWNLVYQNCR